VATLAKPKHAARHAVIDTWCCNGYTYQIQIRGLQALDEHNHTGDPTYIAYVHCKCRHPDCKAAAVEYRQRLQERRRRGDWRDLRYKLRPDSLADEPVVSEGAVSSPEPVGRPRLESPAGSGSPEDTAAVTSDSEAAEESGLSGEANRVLKFLRLAKVDTRGKVDPSMTRMMPTVLTLSPERCQAALDELDQAELLASDGNDLYVVA
jgi:hypothetical protein